MRVHPFTLLLAGGAVACLVLLGIVVYRSTGTSAGEAALSDDQPDAAIASPGPSASSGPRIPRTRGRSVPRFEVRPPSEPPPAQATAAPAPPSEPPERAELKERASKDGFVFREAGTGNMFMVQNGTRFPIRRQEDLQRLGINPADVQEVPRGSVDFLRDRPADGTLWREEGDRTVYYYENGQKRGVTSMDIFEKRGYKWTDVKVIPPGGLVDQTSGAPLSY